ncbi:hypothetical protein LptCag_2347 [Leptospirillum ferriphilum]|uniref:Uncharacterized protein n=1 Tax=Leptospirillum ferriphilum TaxID=178606 RepID=A0A094WBH9_9BACT|nr:hypothetical protein LptCag_2347 [Leptospirillum ferriphilum]
MLLSVHTPQPEKADIFHLLFRHAFGKGRQGGVFHALSFSAE